MKIFISHASKDKNRFVNEFATKLRKKGLDAWVDKWEIKNDPIKIYDPLYECDVFLIILSKNSLESKWVKEEYEIGIRRKVEEDIKFITVILSEDNVEIPNPLKNTLRIEIKNVEKYDDEFKEIVDSILEEYNKPKLGKKPKYIFEASVEPLETFESIIIKEIGNFITIQNTNIPLNFENIIELTKKYELTPEDIKDSIEILEENRYLTFERFAHTKYPELIKLSYKGIIIYGQNYIDNFEEIYRQVSLHILNNNAYTMEDFDEIECPKFLIKAILEYFEGNNYLKLTRFIDGNFIINKLTGKGKRNLKKIIDS